MQEVEVSYFCKVKIKITLNDLPNDFFHALFATRRPPVMIKGRLYYRCHYTRCVLSTMTVIAVPIMHQPHTEATIPVRI